MTTAFCYCSYSPIVKSWTLLSGLAKFGVFFASIKLQNLKLTVLCQKGYQSFTSKEAPNIYLSEGIPGTSTFTLVRLAKMKNRARLKLSLFL